MSKISTGLAGIWAYLQGSKTYLVALGSLAFAVVGDYYHVIDTNTTAILISGALAAAGLRHGISTSAVQAAATVISTRHPDVVANPYIHDVGSIAAQAIEGALEHVQSATMPSSPWPTIPTLPATPAAPEVGTTATATTTGTTS